IRRSRAPTPSRLGGLAGSTGRTSHPVTRWWMYPVYEPPPAALTYSPSLTTSTPHSSWRFTTYRTAAGNSAAACAVTTGPCRNSASNSADRGRFPPCVDRIRSVLCLICAPSVVTRHRGARRRGPESGQGAAVSCVVEHDLDLQADGEIS